MVEPNLDVDELDAKKVEKLKEEVGEEPVKEKLEQVLTDGIRQLYDNREAFKKAVQEQQKKAAQQPT